MFAGLDKFQLFEPRFDNTELEEEFHNFFYKYNLTPLFTNEHRAGSITVTYLDAKSVVNPGGSYHNLLKEFGDFLNMASDNKSYEEAVFKILYEARSFQGLMRSIRGHINYIEQLDPAFLFNMWNIVFYDKSKK